MTAQTLIDPSLVVVRATDTVIDAASLILKHHLRHPPVVDEPGRLPGILNQEPAIRGIDFNTIRFRDRGR